MPVSHLAFSPPSHILSQSLPVCQGRLLSGAPGCSVPSSVGLLSQCLVVNDTNTLPTLRPPPKLPWSPVLLGSLREIPSAPGMSIIIVQHAYWVTVHKPLFELQTVLVEYQNPIRELSGPRPLCRVRSTAKLGCWHPSTAFRDIRKFAPPYGQSPTGRIS